MAKQVGEKTYIEKSSPKSYRRILEVLQKYCVNEAHQVDYFKGKLKVDVFLCSTAAPDAEEE